MNLMKVQSPVHVLAHFLKNADICYFHGFTKYLMKKFLLLVGVFYFTNSKPMVGPIYVSSISLKHKFFVNLFISLKLYILRLS